MMQNKKKNKFNCLNKFLNNTFFKSHQKNLFRFYYCYEKDIKFYKFLIYFTKKSNF